MVGKFSYGGPELDELRIRSLSNATGKWSVKQIIKEQTHSKDGYSYPMRPLIYNAKFKVSEETTQSMAWILFRDLKPTYFVKKSLLYLTTALSKPLHLDTPSIKKTSPSCAKVKV